MKSLLHLYVSASVPRRDRRVSQNEPPRQSRTVAMNKAWRFMFSPFLVPILTVEVPNWNSPWFIPCDRPRRLAMAKRGFPNLLRGWLSIGGSAFELVLRLV